MRMFALATVIFAAGLHAAYAAPSTVTGHGALALSVAVGLPSPFLSQKQKHVLLAIIEDKAPASAAKLSIKAKSVVCRAGDVDIAAFGCVLTYGSRTVSFSGLQASAIYAVMIEAGVPSDGAAGTIYEAAKDISCTLDPAAIAGKDGSGAQCAFTPGQ